MSKLQVVERLMNEVQVSDSFLIISSEDEEVIEVSTCQNPEGESCSQSTFAETPEDETKPSLKMIKAPVPTPQMVGLPRLGETAIVTSASDLAFCIGLLPIYGNVLCCICYHLDNDARNNYSAFSNLYRFYNIIFLSIKINAVLPIAETQETMTYLPNCPPVPSGFEYRHMTIHIVSIYNEFVDSWFGKLFDDFDFILYEHYINFE